MDDSRFPRLVSLACHDLRTPLATIYGFARTLTRMEQHDERTGRYLGMIEEASQQMTELLDELGAAARIEAGRWEPALREVDTAELARTDDERIVVEGNGESIETDIELAGQALRSLALAAPQADRLRHPGHAGPRQGERDLRLGGLEVVRDGARLLHAVTLATP